jgi:hypothetical protein
MGVYNIRKGGRVRAEKENSPPPSQPSANFYQGNVVLGGRVHGSLDPSPPPPSPSNATMSPTAPPHLVSHQTGAEQDPGCGSAPIRDTRNTRDTRQAWGHVGTVSRSWPGPGATAGGIVPGGGEEDDRRGGKEDDRRGGRGAAQEPGTSIDRSIQVSAGRDNGSPSLLFKDLTGHASSPHGRDAFMVFCFVFFSLPPFPSASCPAMF